VQQRREASLARYVIHRAKVSSSEWAMSANVSSSLPAKIKMKK
jgi:hypothetical protein